MLDFFSGILVVLYQKVFSCLFVLVSQSVVVRVMMVMMMMMMTAR